MQFKFSDLKIDDYFPELKYSKLLKTLLFKRGLKTDEIEEFLNLETLDLEDSSKIFGITKAAQVIEKYIQEKKKIIIHGDFDVDGVCATTILWDYLYFVRKADAFPIIPNRADEGYGLSVKTIEKAIAMGGNLIITVDCGIKDAKIVEEYKDKIDFLITDHHQFALDEKGEIILPKAKAVVHSAHPKSKFSSMISGAATAFQLVRELDKLDPVIPVLRMQIPESRQSRDERDSGIPLRYSRNDKDGINDYLDLVAMSTICDIIPLTKENRKLVIKGIQKIAENKRIGLQELMRITSIDPKKVESFHFGFVLGPRINAAGRVLNDAMPAMRLMSTKSISQAAELAAQLDGLNLERQALTKTFLEKAEKQIDPKKKAIVIFGEEWPEGILGLVAGKLSEKYFKPTFVASKNADGEITGSSRSPLPDFYLIHALEFAKDNLTRFGGHKSAAGFASEEKLFADFEKKILEFIEKEIDEKEFERKLEIDLVIEDFDDLNIDSIEEMKLLEPFGFGNTKPIFLFPKVRISNIKYFGKEQNHILIEFEKDGKFLTGKIFNFDPNQIFELNSIVDTAGSIGINEWNGRRSVEVEIKHVISNVIPVSGME